MPTPDKQRAVAESFGIDAARYDRNRPHYPAALIARIVADSPGQSLLDVGCGTGIAARQFQAAGCRVLGVDVDPRMAELARQTGVEAEVGAFETWPPAGRTFDVVVAGQAWLDGTTRAADRTRPGGLRPGGRVAAAGGLALAARSAGRVAGWMGGWPAGWPGGRVAG